MGVFAFHWVWNMMQLGLGQDAGLVEGVEPVLGAKKQAMGGWAGGLRQHHLREGAAKHPSHTLTLTPHISSLHLVPRDPHATRRAAFISLLLTGPRAGSTEMPSPHSGREGDLSTE